MEMQRRFKIGFEDKTGAACETLSFEAHNRLHAFVLFWERQIELVNKEIAPRHWPCRKVTSIKEVTK